MSLHYSSPITRTLPHGFKKVNMSCRVEEKHHCQLSLGANGPYGPKKRHKEDQWGGQSSPNTLVYSHNEPASPCKAKHNVNTTGAKTVVVERLMRR